MVEKARKSLLHFLTKEQPNILSASFVMMFFMLLTKVMGLATKTIAVSRLGAEEYGIFVAANTLPEILSTLLIFGTVTSVIIPILVEVKEQKGVNSLGTLFSSILNAALLGFISISLIIALTADTVTPFVLEKINPVNPFTDGQIAQIVGMMRILLVPQIILGISSFLSSTLNAFKRFVVPQLAPFFYNVGILFGVTVLIPALNDSAWGITWGVLIGSVLHLLIQLPLSSHLKIRYRFVIDVYSKKLREAILVGLPRIISLAADQIAIGVDRILAIGLGAASLGAYHLAVSLVSIPFSLFSNTFSVAALPQLSEEYARRDYKSFRNTFTKVFNQILFLTVPVAAILMVLRVPLVRLMYGIFGGEFTWENTLMVAWVVFFFTIGLIPEVLNVFLTRAFYAIHDTIRPLIVGVFIVTSGIVTGILFTNYFSHFDVFSLKTLTWNPEFFLEKSDGAAAVGGLALSSSIVYSSAFVLFITLLRRRVGSFGPSFWRIAIQKVLFGIAMSVLMYTLFKSWDVVLNTAKTINVLILTLSTIIPGVSIYLWLSYMFKDPEIDMIQKIWRTVRKYARL